ncbi:MAG: ATP synthase F0 subunit B [Proteobacteria bacterium]|nr:ATP synthase F0 subunit B [Pseudomonadota bacterium]MBU1686269.1 ATP synthase F0 subunit B [Pseudomonadota bacterium]
MITIDLTMWIQIANILIMIVIMNIVLYKPIRSILEEREKRIGSFEKDIEEFHKNAKLRLSEFEEKLNNARTRAKDELEQARSTAQSSGAETVGAIRKEVDTGKAASLSDLQTQIASARTELQGQVAGFAGSVAEKILGRGL